MRRLAIVPARGGSKRLRGKNLRTLGGRPLINHTVEVARACFDQVIVSSDDTNILAVVDPAPNVETQLRPSELSTDHSKVIDTVAFYFDQCKAAACDQIWLCLPTCPLRTVSDVVAGQKLLTKDFDGVVSMTAYEFPPSLGLLVDNGLLKGLDPSHPLASGNSRSQDQARVFRPNGAFYGMWWDSFARHRNFYRGKIKGYFMPRARSVDIDTELDLVIAEAVLGQSRTPSTLG